MTTLAQLESLLGTLPSDVVGHIHEYTKHPVAELFKVATRSGQILLRHPSIRRFPRAMGMSFTCHMAYLTSDDALFDSSFEAFEHWYYDKKRTSTTWTGSFLTASSPTLKTCERTCMSED